MLDIITTLEEHLPVSSMEMAKHYHCGSQYQYLCDEWWPGIIESLKEPIGVIPVESLVTKFPDVDITNINEVMTLLKNIAETNDKFAQIMIKYHMDSYVDIHKLLALKIDVSSMMKYKIGYNIKTLERWAKLDNPEKFKELMDKDNYIPAAIMDVKFGALTWNEVQDDIMKGSIGDDGISGLLTLLRSSIAFISSGTGLFITNDMNGISLCSRNSFLSRCSELKIHALNDIDLKSVLFDYLSYITYHKVTYYPGVTSEHVLNLFSGYQGILVPNPNMDKVDVILDHIRTIICNNDDKCYEYFIDWLSYIVQNPKKPGVAILLIDTKGGIGKTMFCEFIMQNIIGLTNSFAVATLSDVSGKFNGHLANKRFIYVSEVKGCSKHDHDTLKANLTDKFIKLERKGHDPIQMESSHCFLLSSNHQNHHFILEDDRRFCVIECSRTVHPREYYVKLAEAMKYHNDFYTFLKTRDISGFDPEIFPKTEKRAEIAETNLNSVQYFLKEISWNDWESASTIYTWYSEFCIKNNLLSIPSNKFKIYADGLIESKRMTKGMAYSKIIR